MEVLDILNDLEELIEEGTRVPLTGKVIVDGDELLDYIDRIRAILPDEIKQAKWITREHQRIINEAEKEAEKIVVGAQEEKSRIADESEVVKVAQAQAEEIVTRAQNVAMEIKGGAANYAEDVLIHLEKSLERFLQEVREGKEELNHIKK